MEEQILFRNQVGESSMEHLVCCHVGKKFLSSRIFSFATVIRLQKLEQKLEKERAEEELKLLLEEREENGLLLHLRVTKYAESANFLYI